MEREPIAVVGAGIAGLSAALSLSQAGFRVELFERAAELKAVGAGIQLSPNALRVLARLGVLDEVAARSVAAETVTLRSARSGRALASVPVAAADGTGYLAIHRADLQDALLAAVRRDPGIRLSLGMALEEARDEGDHVSLSFRHRVTGEVDCRTAWLAVGADGVGSAVAASLRLPKAEDSGLVVARFGLDGGDGFAFDGIEAWLGPRRHAVAYPVRGGAEINIVLIGPKAETGAEVMAGFSHWDGRLNALLDRAAFRGIWPLSTSEPGRRLAYGGRICLIGDAGHAMLPFAAQGAAMAIEDGFMLARALGEEGARRDPAEALRRFEKERLPRLEKVRRRVAFHRFAYHLPYPFSLGRDATLALRSRERLRADLAWLYDWSP